MRGRRPVIKIRPPQSMPPPKIPPMPLDMATRAHFLALRNATIQANKVRRVAGVGLALKQKRLARRAHREEVHKTLRVVLGEATMRQVATQAGLSHPTTWRILMGRMEPGFRLYLRIARAISLLNGRIHRDTIDRYLLRVLKRPMA